MKKIVLAAVVAFGGLITAQAQCKTVSSINENFNNWKDIDKCWSADGGEAMLYFKENKIVFYSMMNPQENMILSTPKVAKGTYTISLDALNKGGKATVVVGQISDPSQTSTFTALTKPVEITEGKKEFTLTLTHDTNIGIKIVLSDIHQAVYIDDVVLKAVN